MSYWVLFLPMLRAVIVRSSRRCLVPTQTHFVFDRSLSTSEMPTTEASDSTKQNSKKKKKRWSREDKRQAAERKEKRLGGGKGQNAPRSLRLAGSAQQDPQQQQQHQLLQCANQCEFTGSVAVLAPSSVDNLPSPLLRIGTSCHSVEIRRQQRSSSATIPTIFIQPLLVLDLNGILCHRIRGGKDSTKIYRPHVASIAGTPIIPRPDLETFLRTLDQHFCLALWSSAKSKTVRGILKALEVPQELQDRFMFVWKQDRCRRVVTEDDVIFEKDLANIWKFYPLWNEHNTWLVDDSPEKCIAWPNNAIHPDPLNGTEEDEATVQRQVGEFQQLIQRLSNEQVVEVATEKQTRV